MRKDVLSQEIKQNIQTKLCSCESSYQCRMTENKTIKYYTEKCLFGARSSCKCVRKLCNNKEENWQDQIVKDLARKPYEE